MATYSTRKQSNAARRQTIARNAARTLKRNAAARVTRAGRARNAQNRTR